ncbi:MAG: 50S ribosomal protein L29 [Planctomycetes bacterium]|nr:50S ribosomal protein L29 [Planctomycetota bacterium]
MAGNKSEKIPVREMSAEQLRETLEVNRRSLVEHRVTAISKKRMGSSRQMRRQTARILTQLRALEN